MSIGFIGGSGHHYLRSAVKDEAIERIAVASDGYDRDASKSFLQSLRDANPRREIEWFDNGAAMLDTFKPSVVSVVSVGGVYGFNGLWNAETLVRNIPTVSDKPIASTWEQLLKLNELVEANPSRILLTEFDFRARPEFRAARECVQKGAIGEIVLATAQKSYRFNTRPQWYRSREWYGGITLWIASHGLDGVEFVTGLKIVRSTGRSGNRSRPDYAGTEDHVAIVAELDGGASAMVHADFCRPASASSHGDDRLRVVGSRGQIKICGDGICRLTTVDQPETVVNPMTRVLPIEHEFLATIRGEGAEGVYSTRQSLRTAAMLLRVRDSVDRGEWLSIER